jgi:protein involved in polysaccharide export with SLBB domain
MRRGMGWLWVCLGLLVGPGLASAQEYVLGAEDVIAISIYLHPEL